MKYLVAALLAFVSPSAFASTACLGVIEGQILGLANAQIAAKGNGIRQSRVTLLHNYACSGDPATNMECYVDSKVFGEDNNRNAYLFSFQSSYMPKKDCLEVGAVKTVQSPKILEGEAAEKQKSDDDSTMMKLLSDN
jgi:hypothetical protein